MYSYLCYLESTNGNPWLPWSPWLPRFPKQLNLAFTTVLGLESNNTDFRVIFSGFRFCYRGSGEFWDLERKVATLFCDRLLSGDRLLPPPGHLECLSAVIGIPGSLVTLPGYPGFLSN